MAHRRPRRRRPRHLGSLAAFLALGLLSTVLCAWGIAVLGAPFPLSFAADARLVVPSISPEPDESTWMLRPQRMPGRRAYVYDQVASSALRGTPLADADTAPSIPTIPAADIPSWARPPATSNAIIVRMNGFGWPLVALAGRRDTFPESHEMHGYRIIRGWSASSGDIWLPIRPVWTGLAINTAFWAGAWWMLLVLPGMLRRASRKRRGLCPKCAYDLRGTLGAGCPECGWNREDSPVDSHEPPAASRSDS